jgi:hypothetical protein
MRFFLLVFWIFFTSEIEAQSLIFENRAACAQDSRLPAEAAYVMVDAYTAGKWLDSYRQATSVEGGPEVSIERGLERFRTEFTYLLLALSEALVSGSLPLLRSGEAPSPIAWRGGAGSVTNRSPTTGVHLSCRRILRFSSLQSEGALGIPDRKWLRRIAEDYQKKSENEEDCLNSGSAGDSRRYLLRLEILPQARQDWIRTGFDFWHSLRAYLFAAWPESSSFPHLALDQMLTFLPVGCRSIERPECGREQVSLQQVRSLLFSSSPGADDRFFLVHPQDSLLQTAHTERAERIFPDEGEVDSWLRRMESRLLGVRGEMKRRLLGALASLDLAKAFLSKDQMTRHLNELRVVSGAREKLHAMCSEVLYALHPDWGRFQSRLQALRNRDLTEWSQWLGEDSILERIEVGMNLGTEVLRFCEESRVAGLWRQGSVLQSDQFADWYRASALDQALEERRGGDLGVLFNREITSAAPLIQQERIGGDGFLRTEILCRDGSDCVRWWMSGLLDLLRVLDWSEALIRARQTALSPHWMNPWTASTACGSYDPEAALRRARTLLMGDLLSSMISGLTPVPVWASFHRPSAPIEGWRELEDGRWVPLRAARVPEGSMGLDLGPLSGIPCAVLAGQNAPDLTLPPVYQLAGIRAQVCSRTERHRVVFRSGEGRVEGPTARSTCLVCVLSPMSAAGPALRALSLPAPLLRLAAGVVAGAWRYVRHTRDPHDVPKRYRVDPSKVHDAFERYPEPSERCLRRLLKGKGCR